MMNPKTPCPNCEAMRRLDWCRKHCSRSVATAPKKPESGLDGRISLKMAHDLLRLNAMRSPEDRKRCPKPVRATEAESALDAIYPSVAQAARAISETMNRHVRTTDVINVCAGRQTAVFGFRFEYVTLEVEE